MPALRSHPNAALIASPAMREKIVLAIGKRVPETEAGDIAQKAYVRLLLVVDAKPLEQLLALAVTIVRGLIVDHYRDRRRALRRQDDGADVDELHPQEQGDPATQQLVAKVSAWIDEEVKAGRIPEDYVRWSKRIAEGTTVEEIAAEEGRPAASIRVILHRCRKHVSKQWPKYAGGGVALAVLLLLLFRQPGEDRPQHLPASPPPSAAQLRARAYKECASRAFDACERDLDRAKKDDPAGEDDAKVKDARRAIAEARAGH
jgi:RNA polymerase sigma factor (sigma-70 family)